MPQLSERGNAFSSDWLARHEVGGGSVAQLGEGLRLEVGRQDGERYSNAQVDDYHAEDVLRWQPPVTMRVYARFSAEARHLCGTAGFGFWNDPFAMTAQARTRLPRLRLPQAIWFFFASPPSNMALAKGVKGYGWKAATLDATSTAAKALLPFAPLGMIACRVPALYEGVWPVAQHVLKINEMPVAAAMQEWHVYELEWRVGGARWSVDGEEILFSPIAPRGPLGFVTWIDNQYLIATPQGRFRSGTIACAGQWLEISTLTVVPG